MSERKKPNRTQCFRMSGRLDGIVAVLRSDLNNPARSEQERQIRESSRFEVMKKTLREACDMLEALAPPFDKKGQ